MEKLGPFYTVGRKAKYCSSDYRKHMDIPQKVKNRITIWSSNPTLSIYPKELKARSQKDIYTPMFITALFTIHQKQKASQCQPVDEWVKKKYFNVVLTYNGAWFSLEKEESLVTCNNMDKPWGHYSEWNKPTERQIPYESTYMRYLK